MKHSHWRDRNFAHRMEQRHRHGVWVGRIVIGLVVAYLLGIAVWSYATSSDQPQYEDDIPRYYEPPPGPLR